MKKLFSLAKPLMFATTLTLLPTARSEAQITEIISAIIKAADIAVQKAQNATIELQNVQKQIENALSKSKLADIASWVQKQKDLYQDYFNELWQVKKVIADYKRVIAIIERQKQLVADYKRAWSLVQQDSHFTAAEMKYILSVYSGIIDESVKNLDQLTDMITDLKVQMSDTERLSIVNSCSDGIEQQMTDLKQFNDQIVQASLQRSTSEQDLEAVRQLYGL